MKFEFHNAIEIRSQALHRLTALNQMRMRRFFEFEYQLPVEIMLA